MVNEITTANGGPNEKRLTKKFDDEQKKYFIFGPFSVIFFMN